MAASKPSSTIDASEAQEARDTKLEDDLATFNARVRPRMDIQNYFVSSEYPLERSKLRRAGWTQRSRQVFEMADDLAIARLYTPRHDNTIAFGCRLGHCHSMHFCLCTSK
jgi:hypothetical protein